MKWRWFLGNPQSWGLKAGLSMLLGFCLVVIIHSCATQPVASPPSDLPANSAGDITTTSPSSASAANDSTQQDISLTTGTVTEPVALSPETAALVASVEPDGLYNPPRGDVRLVVFSDLNNAYGSTDYDPEVDKAIALLPFWQPDMVICSGDMVAGQNLSLSDEELQAMWAAFDDHVAAPIRQANLPFGITMGNHDASSSQDSSGNFVFERERTVAGNYWNQPVHDPGVEFVDRNDFPFYYSFMFNDVFFVVWDGSSFKIPGEKLAWVEQTLESPAAQSAKLKILLGHLPLYSVAVGRDRPGEVMANADDLRTMLERHQVHTYISGHHHAYYPAHKGNLQLLHTGIIGSGPRQYLGSSLSPRKTLTVLDINFDDPDLTSYTAYDMQSLALVNLDELPQFISGHNGTVWRRDVEMEDPA